MPHDKIEIIWKKFGVVAQKNFLALPPLVRPVITTHSAQGVIDNGGFAYFFECDWPGIDDWNIFVQDFAAVGHHKAAVAIRAALELFPGGHSQSALKERRSYIFGTLGGTDGKLGDLDGPICGKSAVLKRLLEGYIKVHEIA
jgi:hypothetical protein